MAENAGDKNANKPAGAGPRTLGGYLASALDMEERLSGGVYEEYMDIDNWPAGVKRDVFLQVRKHLATLIEDTKRHKKTILALTNRYTDGKESD